MSGKAVRAGGAELELTVKSRVEQGLANAKEKLNSFGKTLGIAGGAMAGFGAGIVTPLIGMATNFSNVGDAIQKMSVRTGMAAEDVSTLGFAAQQSGSDLETVERGFIGMAKSLDAANDGSKAQVDALAAIGLHAQQLRGLNPADQFKMMAEGISQVEDPTDKAALAMELFGKSGQKLIPLLNEGAGGISALQEEARSLGLEMSGETANAAAALNDALGRVTSSAHAIFLVMGEAVAPILTATLGPITGIVKSIVAWMKGNKALISTIFLAGTAILGIGTAVTGLGVASMAAAAGIGMLGTLLAFATSGPVLIVGATLAAIAAAAYIFRDSLMAFGSDFVAMMEPAREAMSQIWSIFSTTFEGIKNALSAGEMRAAATILWAGIQAVFYTGVENLEQLFEWMFGAATGWLKGIGDAVLSGNFSTAWEIAWAQIVLWFTQGTTTVTRLWSYFVFGLGDTFGEVFSGLRSVFYSVMGSISAGLEATVGKLRELLTAIADYDPTGLAAKTSAALSVASLAYGSAGDEFNRLQEQEAKDREVRSRDRYKALEGRLAAADAELAARQADADAAIAKAADERGGLTEAMSVAKRKELEALVANFAESDAVASVDELPDTDGAERVARSTSAIGSFSAVAASILGRGSGSAVEETARHTRETAAQTKLMNGKLQQLVERPADGGAAFA